AEDRRDRPHAQADTSAARTGCDKHQRSEPVRGPQHHEKPAATKHVQSESRAAHVTAKATTPASRSGSARAGGLGGVEGAARGHGAERNRRGPSARPEWGQRLLDKPPAKTKPAQRQ